MILSARQSRTMQVSSPHLNHSRSVVNPVTQSHTPKIQAKIKSSTHLGITICGCAPGAFGARRDRTTRTPPVDLVRGCVGAAGAHRGGGGLPARRVGRRVRGTTTPGRVAAGELPGRQYDASAATLNSAGLMNAQDMPSLFAHSLDPANPAFNDPPGWTTIRTTHRGWTTPNQTIAVVRTTPNQTVPVVRVAVATRSLVANHSPRVNHPRQRYPNTEKLYGHACPSGETPRSRPRAATQQINGPAFGGAVLAGPGLAPAAPPHKAALGTSARVNRKKRAIHPPGRPATTLRGASAADAGAPQAAGSSPPPRLCGPSTSTGQLGADHDPHRSGGQDPPTPHPHP